MSTLTKSQIVSPSLTGDKLEIVKAYYSERTCVALKDPKKVEYCFDLISRYIQDSDIIGGFKTKDLDERERNELCKEIIDILKKNQFLGIDEVDFIIKQGLMGNLGESFGFTVRSFNSWLKHYQYNQRSEAMKEQIRFNERLETEREEERRKDLQIESRQRSEEGIKVLIEHYSDVEKWQDIPSDYKNHSGYYDYLKLNNMITVSGKERTEIHLKHFARLKKSLDFLHARTEIIDAKARLLGKDEVFRMELFRIINEK